MILEGYATVLLIDDSSDDRLLISRCLTQDPEQTYHILEAYTGAEGLHLCQQALPDIILLDYHLPDLDGLEVLQQIQAHHAIPVVILTGQEQLELAVQAMKSGAEDYLFKHHLTAPLLQRTLRSALKQNRLQQQLAQQQSIIAQQLRIQRELEESQFCLRLINAVTADRQIDLTADQVIARILNQIRLFYSGLRVYYCTLEVNSSRLRCQRSLHPPGLADCTGMEFDLSQVPEYLAGLQALQPCITNDIFQAPQLTGTIQILQSLNFRAMLEIPLQHADGVIGLIGLSCDQCRHWSAREVQTFREIADFLAFALQSVRMREQQLLAESALRQSEEQNRAILSATPDIMAILDEQGTYLSCSFNQFTGDLIPVNDGQDVTGMHVTEVLPPEFAEQWLVKIQQVLATGEMQVHEQQNRFGDRIQYEEVRMVPYRENQILCLVRNITDRKQVEISLRQSEAKNNALIRALPDLIMRLNRDGVYLDFFTTSMFKVIGDRDALLGTRVRESLPPALAERRMAAIEAACQTGELQVYEQEVWVDGGLQTEECRVVPCGENEVLVIGRDITDRTNAEAALRQSEAKNRAMLAAIPDLLLRVKLDGTCLDFIPPSAPLDTDFLPIQSHLSEILPPVLLHQQLERMRQAIVTKELQVWEHQLWRFGELRDEEVRLVHCEEDEFVIIVRDITDRKQAERALRQSEAIQNAIIQTIPDLLIRMDREGNYRELISSQYLRLLLPDQPIQESGLADILSTELTAQRLEYTRLALDTNTMQVHEQVLELDGEHCYEEVRIVPLMDQEVLMIIRDITDRKRAELALQQLNEELEQRVQDRTQELVRSEKALRESQQFIQTVLDTVPLPMFWKDRNSIFLGCNQQLATIMGLASTSEIIGKTGFDFSPTPTEALEYQADDRRVMESGIAKLGIEETFTLDNGEQRWIETHKAPLRDWQGNVVGIVGMFQDITDRKRAEETLRSEQLRLQLALEAAEMGTWSCNLTTGVLVWSDRAQEIFGFAPGTFPGDRETFLALVHEDDRERVVQAIIHTFETQAPYHLEYRIYRLDGELRWINVWGIIPQDLPVAERQLIGVVADITDPKQAEDVLRQLNQELEQRVSDRTLELQRAMEEAEAANEAKSTFLANMSHELRTPLNAILGFAQLMSRDLTIAPDKRNQLAIINRSGKHLLSLINDILEMSKIEAGRVSFTPNSFNLYTLLSNLKDLFQIRALEKSLQFLIEHDQRIPQYIETDENKLRQVLINLVGNAIKFTNRGTVVLHLSHQRSVILESEPGVPDLYLHFAVQDTGIGIDPTEINSLFEPFIQSSQRQALSQEGTGLGLPISRQFVRLMGGDLTVQSTPGVGSRFSFTIPVRLGTPELTAPAPTRHVIGLAPNQPNYRVLVVEDNETNRDLLVQFLSSVGFKVQTATHGLEAIALWETWHPQLIWMDMRMPIMDGYTATERIRLLEHQQSPSPTPTVIIALTANAFEEDRTKILAIGCNDFVRKPYQETELLDLMANYLGVHYLYADVDELTSPAPVNSAPFNPAAALRVLPAGDLAQLYQATIQLDNQKLATLIEAIALDQPTLANFLQEKLQEFDLEPILTLLQEVLQVQG